jgi:UDP-N-acetylmuramyl pentapeptide phosphotransferase/UDP-N-acetylglucosamine-1-phosphate transferase
VAAVQAPSSTSWYPLFRFGFSTGSVTLGLAVTGLIEKRTDVFWRGKGVLTMKMMIMLAVAIVAWFFYFQTIDWFMMKIQGLDYFTFLKI